LALTEADPQSGVYMATLPALLAGVYRFRLLAQGKSLRARPFSREHLLTGAIWKGGDQPPPNSATEPGAAHDRLCRLLGCLFGEKVLTPTFEKNLAERGVDLRTLRECLKTWCQQRARPGALTSTQVRPLAAAEAVSSLSPADAVGSALPASTVDLIRQLTRELDRVQR
jgi:hypothetical protein